jgi:predicted nucleic acid-binding protein
LLAFDASSIVHAWDHYPIGQFPKLWIWLGEEFESARFALPQVANDEIKRRDSNCHSWLHAHSVKIIQVTQAIIEDALEIKGMLGITSERDYRGGVDENDLLIIATCMQSGLELISNEGRQNELPRIAANYKIPSVCGMNKIHVPCINFRELLIRSGKVFG